MAERAKNVDHVLVWDPVSAGVTEWPTDQSTNPFVRYRTLQHSYWLNRARGATDSDHVQLVERLDHAIAGLEVGGTATGFRVTPLVPLDGASERLGVEVWAKNDTGNVAGSQKARHLMGILLHLEARRFDTRTPLAIASCGNAAIAAATLGRAARRPVEVYVPVGANPAVLRQLQALHAKITECPRLPTDPPGDPCIHRFREAVARGALPFCVQGPENGLTIDGGATMGHELADQFAMLGRVPDRCFVQVGGGALGSAVVRGLRDALALGVIETLPKLHCVQTQGCAPLERAWRGVVTRALRSLGHASLLEDGDAAVAAALMDQSARPAVDEALLYALTHRSQFMWPWEEEPTSAATGILDDETYDWAALVRAMIGTGGYPVVVDESHVRDATSLVNAEIDADETGSAALAGVVAQSAGGLLGPTEQVVALVTGIRRR